MSLILQLIIYLLTISDSLIILLGIIFYVLICKIHLWLIRRLKYKKYDRLYLTHIQFDLSHIIRALCRLCNIKGKRKSILSRFSQRKQFRRRCFMLEFTNLFPQLVGRLTVQWLDQSYFLCYLLLYYGPILLLHSETLHFAQEIHPLADSLRHYEEQNDAIYCLLVLKFKIDLRILQNW